MREKRSKKAMKMFLLAFSGSCGMISGFMSSDKPLPPETKEAHRQADFYDLLAWFEVNKAKVLIGAAILVVIGFVIAAVRYMREQKEIKASSELLALRVALTPSTNMAPPQPTEFLKVAQDFSGTSAAERARFLAGTAFFTEGKYSEAEREFSAFVKEFSNSPWVASAAYGIAAAQEAQNKPEAMASYQNVATSYPNSPVADNAKLALARIHEGRNQPDQALRIYNELLAPRPGAQPGEQAHPEALVGKEALLRKHPELSTNVPPARVGAAPQTGTNSSTLNLPSTVERPAATNSAK